MAGLTDYYENILEVDPGTIRYIEEDFVSARIMSSGTLYVLAYGDPVIVDEVSSTGTKIRIVGGRFHGAQARVKGELPTLEKPIFRFSMVDVQQGDGMVVETPEGKIILIDGGDNPLFARHLAARYAHTTANKRLRVDGIIITHGDADHFDGLSDIRRSESIRNTDEEPFREKKRLFIRVDRVFHNGLVKRPTSVGETAIFGATATDGDGELFCTQLEDDPRDVPATQLNQFFKQWVASLKHWAEVQPIEVSRVSQVKNARIKALFGEGSLVSTDVLGPLEKKIQGKPALKFLKEPRKLTELHLSEGPSVTNSHSASHTVNGHSISLRIHCGNVRFLLTGDLNQQSMAALEGDVECEILKAPHHGSADFDFEMLEKARPVVSLISSGDESTSKEFIHPRATLVAALGKVSRGKTGVIFMTELAAFFSVRGNAVVTDQTARRTARFDPTRPFFAFERTNFGIIHVRTDGERVLAFTHSGKDGVNEGYSFTVDAQHEVRFAKNLKMRTAPT